MSLTVRVSKAIFAIACLLSCKFATSAYAEPVNQATIEAAITLQLLSFTEWPPEGEQSETGPRKIGIYQSKDHLEAFEALSTDERYQNRFTAIAIDDELSAQQLADFDAIFFPSPEDIAIPRIVRKLENRPVVLIGAFDGFLEQGGMVNLVKSQKKLRFEIQLANSKRRGIEYRAKLLRLAAKIIRE